MNHVSVKSLASCFFHLNLALPSQLCFFPRHLLGKNINNNSRFMKTYGSCVTDCKVLLLYLDFSGCFSLFSTQKTLKETVTDAIFNND